MKIERGIKKMNSNGNCVMAKNKNWIEQILEQILPEKLAGMAYQFIKCAVVGASNTLVDLAVLNLLMFLADIRTGIYVTAFSGISFIVADTNSFIWNKFWTFKDKKKNSQELMRQIIAFLLVSLGGLVINVSAVHVIVNVIGHHWGISATLWANIAKLCAVFLTIVWNFTGYKLIVFKK